MTKNKKISSFTDKKGFLRSLLITRFLMSKLSSANELDMKKINIINNLILNRYN